MSVKRIIAVFSACTLVLGASSALAAVDAAKAEATAKSAGCLTCHAVDKKKMGPSFKDASALLKKEGATTTDKAVAAIKSKAAHKSLKSKDDDIKAIADWILSM